MSKKILIIDDEDNLRFLERKFLEMAGYDVQEAADGDAGLKMAKAYQPDVVLLDVIMPKKDGYQVAQEFAKDEKLSKTPIILVTGTSQVVGEGIKLKTPAKFKLAKPFSKEQLFEVVEKALKS
ncbi:MAG: response regulator [Candidatus Margulisbacteria bacterium]|nr:response regulator [Candidatus Margulisiibacteriota bacterium]